MTDVTLENVSMVYAGGVTALRGLSLTCRGGAVSVILGPSGCGKSTLLRLVAGLATPTSGRVLIGGRDVGRVPPRERGVAMVFQNAALYPHMSVAQNIAFPLRQRGLSSRDAMPRVHAAAEMLRVGEGLLSRRPGQLSGGQRQRVAIAKAIAAEPDVLLMDEPLSALDADLRSTLRTELKALHARLGMTMLYVTHDAEDARVLADETVRLDTPEK